MTPKPEPTHECCWHDVPGSANEVVCCHCGVHYHHGPYMPVAPLPFAIDHGIYQNPLRACRVCGKVNCTDTHVWFSANSEPKL